MIRLLATLLLAGACTPPGPPAVARPVAPPPPTAAPAVANQALDGANLEAFMQATFAAEIVAGRLEPDFATGRDDVLAELAALGITTTGQLAALVPGDFKRRAFDVMKLRNADTNFTGLLRDVLIIANVERFAELAWHNQFVARPGSFPVPNAYGITDAYLIELGIVAPHTDDEPDDVFLHD